MFGDAINLLQNVIEAQERNVIYSKLAEKHLATELIPIPAIKSTKDNCGSSHVLYTKAPKQLGGETRHHSINNCHRIVMVSIGFLKIKPSFGYKESRPKQALPQHVIVQPTDT